MSEQLEVTVKFSYHDVAKTTDQRLCAQILSLIKSVETPEQQRIGELEKQLLEAKSAKDTADYYKGQAETKLKELQQKVGAL